MLPYIGVLLTATVAVCASVAEVEPWPYHCAAGMETSELAVNLTGKTMLVTGSDGRLGFQVALAAARAGATVIASTRSLRKCDDVKKRIDAEIVGTGGAVETLVMDLSSFDSVRIAAHEVLTSHGTLDVVVQVAGVAGQDNLTADGFVGTLQINVLAPAYLTKLLLPALMSAPAPRVVYIGSMAAFGNMHWPSKDPVSALMRWTRGQETIPTSSYGLSKLLDSHYAAEQALRMPNLTIFSVSPGFFRDPPSAYKCPAVVLFKPCPQTPAQGATSTFFAAAQPGIEANSGAMFDFETRHSASDPYIWTQSGETCIPRALPAWDAKFRAQWYDEVQTLLKDMTVAVV